MLQEIRPGRQIWIEVQEGSQAGRHAGRRATVIFVHGSCANRHQFRAQAGVLREAGVSTIVYDHLGCGDSDKPRQPTVYHPDEMTADLHQIVQLHTEEEERLYVVGHSFGTAMACRVAAELGERLCGLLLLGATYPRPGGRAINRLFYLPEWVLGWMQPSLTQGFLHPRTFEEQPALVETERQYANSNPPHMFKAFHTQSGDMFHPVERFHEWVKRIKARTLVVMGEGDQLTPVELGAQMAAALPNGQLRVIPEASHQVMQEKPEEVNQLILTLIEETLP